MRTIKLCACDSRQPTTLLEAIRRSAAEIERRHQVRNPRPAPKAAAA